MEQFHKGKEYLCGLKKFLWYFGWHAPHVHSILKYLFLILLCRWCLKVLLLIVLPWRWFSAISLYSLMRTSVIAEEALGFISSSSLQGISIALTSLLSLLIGFILGAIYWKVRSISLNCLHSYTIFHGYREAGRTEWSCMWKS